MGTNAAYRPNQSQKQTHSLTFFFPFQLHLQLNYLLTAALMTDDKRRARNEVWNYVTVTECCSCPDCEHYWVCVSLSLVKTPAAFKTDGLVSNPHVFQRPTFFLVLDSRTAAPWYYPAHVYSHCVMSDALHGGPV